MRIVLDANVLISAVLRPRSKPAQVYRFAVTHRLLRNPAVMDECEGLFRREKFDRYSDPLTRREFVAEFVSLSELVEVAVEIRACRDSKDDKYLELAISGLADCLVTGDADLLALNPFRGIAILTPAEFLERVATA